MKQSDGNIYSGAAITTTEASEVIDLRQVYGLALHFKWTKNSGTVSGSFKLQVSNDNENFIDYTGASVALTDSNGEGFYEKDGIHFQYAKIVLTMTGGNIDFNTYLGTKG